MDKKLITDLTEGVLSGRVSRRDLMKRGAVLGLSAPAMGILLRASDAAAAGNLEIFSWWTSPGETVALQTLFDNFTATYPDVEIVNAAVAGAAGVNAIAVLRTRLEGGKPPDSWQTHVGRELFDNWVVPGYSEPITDLYASEGWDTALPQGLIDQVTMDGEKWAVPVNVHRGNTLWYSKQVLADNSIEVGDAISYDEFIAVCETLKTAGVTAVAFSSVDGFEPLHVWEDVLAATVGADNYNKLFAGEMAWDDQGVKDATENFLTILGYANEDHPALNWSAAIGMLVDGTAAFNVMGDWAYGEVVAKSAQDAIGYVSSPGTAGTFVTVVDCFNMPKGAPNAENAVNWLKVCGSVKGQQDFNPLKGSIPARTDVDLAQFSPYHQWSAASFAADNLVPSCAHGAAASPAFKQVIMDASVVLVLDKDVDAFITALVDGWAAESA